MPRRLAALPAVVSCLVVNAGLRAQVIPHSINPNDTTPPVVTLTPGSEQVSVTSLAVTIDWCDDNTLNAISRNITLRGTNVTSSFSYTTSFKTGCKVHATSSGTITLIEGMNYLNASIQDGIGNLGQSPATYTYVPAYRVAVTPKGGRAPNRPANTSGYAAVFTVENTGSSSDTYTFTCGTTGPLTCSAVHPSSTTVASLGSTTDTAVYAVGSPGTGVLTLTATSTHTSDAGFDTVAVIPAVTPAGPVVARDLCLTIGVGPDAAYDCGELRILHALPSVRMLNTSRTPTLLYSSQQADPFPSLNADLTLAAGDRPDSIIAIASLKVAGAYVQRDRRAWAGSQWGVSTQAATRRVMTNFAATDLATGFYPFKLELQRLVTGAGYTTIRTDTGSIVVINRFASPFGAGWWLAGFEQLRFLSDSSLLWIGGNGSVRRYVAAGAWNGKSWYVTRELSRPDTLSFDGTTYTRYLTGGARVLFNTSGFQTEAVNRLGYATVFTADGSGRLSAITLPPAGSGRTYTFTYAGPNGTLSAVAAPDSAGGGSRTTAVTGSALTGGARISSIRDPGVSTSVQFTYGNGSYPAAITARTDRRGATTTYLFGTGLRLVGDSLPVVGSATIRRTFCPAEIRVWTCGSGLTAPESTYTVYDGPRTDSADVTDFWLDSLGAVTQIRDPYNHLTTVARTDARFPELPTRVQSPSGQVVGATYDARGNVAAVTDSNAWSDGRNPTTRYTWDQRWDQLTSITLPNGQLTQFSVDTTNGNRLWVQDARGAASRTTFQYYASGNGTGLLSAVTPPLGAATHIWYDVRGNTDSVKTGIWTTAYLNDSIGRTKVVRTPIAASTWRTDTTTYDAADRAVRVASYAPVVGSAPAALTTVFNFYDDEDNRIKVERTQWPDPTQIGTLTSQWVFDAANRPTVAIAPDGNRDTTWYDAAGNIDSTRMRNGNVLRMAYDRMNRLRRRITPSVTYAARTSPGKLGQVDLYGDQYNGVRSYPWFSNNGTGLTISADTAWFAYDAGGRMLSADNGDARVRRTYFTSGQVQTDSLWIRNYSGNTFAHAYGLRYSYDLNGRTSALHHPAQLAAGPGARDSVHYAYDDTTGALGSVTTLLGNQTSFLYDLNGRLVRETRPGGIVDSTVYDSLGRETLEQVTNGSTSSYKDPDTLLRHTILQYAVDPARVSAALNTHGWKDTLLASYTGTGSLSSLSYSRPANTSDSALYVGTGGDAASQSFHLDPLGNTHGGYASTTGSIGYGNSFSQGSTDTSFFHNATGRIDSTSDAAGGHSFLYDADGNTVFFDQYGTSGSALNDRASWYGADGRLRVAEWRGAQKVFNPDWTNPGWTDVFEEYRYDALGRRVLVMSRQGCVLNTDSTSFEDCQVSRVRRTVWDGARELWEIQMPARAQDSLWIENDTATVTYWAGTNVYLTYSDPNPLFGRVGYTYANGVDRPLAITRFKLVRRKTTSEAAYWPPVELEPNWNWRGEADLGTFANGGMETCTDSTHCVFVQWRGGAFATGLAHELLWSQFRPLSPSPNGWFGTLVNDKVDGTGTFYRRNRFVDPMTGRFTQEDPIGLAGGLNEYGFAAGDPVTYSDPFGLCPIEQRGNCTQADYAGQGQTQNVQPSRLTRAVASLMATVRSVTSRPSHFRKATIQRAWDEAEPGPNGGRLCPTCGGEVTVAPGEGARDWHVDHITCL